MPNIKEYGAPQGLALQPDERGIDATLQVARRAGAFFNQAADAVKTVGDMQGRMAASGIELAGRVALDHADHAQISHGALADAALTALKTKEWDNTIKGYTDANGVAHPPADPNDTSIAQTFMEGLEGDLAKFKDGFTTEKGQAWAESHVQHLRTQFQHKTAADMAAMAGQAVTENYRKTSNLLSNTAMMSPDAVPSLIEQAKSGIAGIVGSAPNLKGIVASKATSELTQKTIEQIVQAGAFGAIQAAADPEATAARWAAKYPEYIDGAHARTLAKAATAQQKSNLYYQKGAEQYQHTQDVRAADAAFSKTWTENVSFDQNGKATINPTLFKEVMATEMKYPGAQTERAKALINWAQSQQRERKQNIVTDRAVQSSLYDGLFKTDSPTTDVDILKAAAADKLDAHDTSTLIQLHKALEDAPLKGPIWKDTMDAVKSGLIVSIPGVPGKDEKGLQNYAKFMQTFIPEYQRLMREGRVPPNALDVTDKESMISKAMAPFHRSPTQRMQDYIEIFGGLSLNTNLTGPGKAVGDVMQVIDIPAGMTPAQAVKLYPGRTVKLPDGRTKVLPNE